MVPCINVYIYIDIRIYANHEMINIIIKLIRFISSVTKELHCIEL